MTVSGRKSAWPQSTAVWLVLAAVWAVQATVAPQWATASFQAAGHVTAAETVVGSEFAIDSSGPTLNATAEASAAPAAAATVTTPAQNSNGHVKAAPVSASSAAKGAVAKPVSTKVVAAGTIAPPPCASEPAHCQPEVVHCVPRTQDEVWLVSSRCLGCPDFEAMPPNFRVWRYDLNTHEWNESSLQAFLDDQDASKPDVFWLHGYRIDFEESEEQGLGVYEQLTCGVSGDRPIRMVIYSWPSTQCGGIIEDVRVKAARTNIDGYYLAWLVNHIDRHVTVDLIGYSYGARIVTGALELLAGGALMGRALPDPIQHRAAMHAIIIAAAVNSDWLAMNRPHGQALNAVDQMLALNNGCDRALKHYGVIDPCSKPEALGYTGALGPLGDNGNKLYEVDLCCAVGKQHNWKSYFYSPSVVARMRPYVGLDGKEQLQSADRKVLSDKR